MMKPDDQQPHSLAVPRDLAPVDEVLHIPEVRELSERFPQEVVTAAVRAVLGRLRSEILDGEREVDASQVTAKSVAPWVVALVERSARPSLRRVINALGVVGHTNLGRSLLPDECVRAVASAAAFYSDLEIDLENGERGSRQVHVHDALCDLTGAEDALVVNNNAGAVLLALAATARDGEVMVSRGQLVEIGDGFRIPDILRESGAALVEVGTTNRTYLRDFEQAWTDRTRAVLRVHTSNYRIVGFATEPSLDELLALAHGRDAVMIDDLGSGALAELELFTEEPSIRASLEAGVDIVTFSGDKLLGGPQAGIVLGRSRAVDVMRRHPLARALRIDKLGIAALDALLRLYIDPEVALRQVPTLAMLRASADEVAARAAQLGELLLKRTAGADVAGGWPREGDLEVVSTVARAGAGSLPVTDIESAALAVRPARGEAGELADRLRDGDPPVLARIQERRVLLDLRAVRDQELDDLAEAVIRAVA